MNISFTYISEFERYAGLFAEQGDFDIPDSFNVGLSWDVNNFGFRGLSSA